MSQAREVLEGVISETDCQNLLVLAQALSTVGYRDCVASALITGIAQRANLLPLVAAREAVRSAVEEALALPLGLLIEFTGLISWRPGASIGWHHDANRPYLQQRTAAAVCYLNQAGRDFEGGTFRFENGSPQVVHAAPGRVVAYSAQDSHCVDPITSGERFTLTLWFTQDPAHCEDTKLLAQLAGPVPRPLGLPASLWCLPDGTDLRLCRLAMAGLGLVWQGQLLHSTADLPEDDGSAGGSPQLRLQLAIQPSVFRAWLEYQCAPLPCGEGGVNSSDDSAAGTARISEEHGCGSAASLAGIDFGSVEEAVLSVQHFLLDFGEKQRTRERVCCQHLCTAPTMQPSAPSCSWLRSCRIEHSQGCTDAEELPFTAEDMQRVAQACTAMLAKQQAEVDRLLPQWLQSGALFIAD